MRLDQASRGPTNLPPPCPARYTAGNYDRFHRVCEGRIMQRALFLAEQPSNGLTSPTEGLFADVVLDRPLDHAFSYLVPEALRERVAIGKRVRVPFGRGDRPAIGYCVGLGETPPAVAARSIKEVQEVLDDEVLLTDHLLRLTR